MINQFWEKPYNRDETVVTTKDWNQYLAPSIKSEILTNIASVAAELNQVKTNYVRLADYHYLESQYYSLKMKYDETMQILAIKGLITEEDIKEFHDSRKLAKSMAEAERVGIPNGVGLSNKSLGLEHI